MQARSAAPSQRGLLKSACRFSRRLSASIKSAPAKYDALKLFKTCAKDSTLIQVDVTARSVKPRCRYPISRASTKAFWEGINLPLIRSVGGRPSRKTERRL